MTACNAVDFTPYRVNWDGRWFDGTDPDADFVITEPGVGGLGLPGYKTNDVDRLEWHGSRAGNDFSGPKTITVPLMIYRPGDPRATNQATRTIKGSMRPRVVANALTVNILGIGPSNDQVLFFVRPRGPIPERHSTLRKGAMELLLSFEATDPIAYGPPESVAVMTQGAPGNVTVTNDGDAPTWRTTLDVEGNGSTPYIINAGDNDRWIEFVEPIPGGETWTIDLRKRVVTNASGVPQLQAIANSSPWFVLQPGDNVFDVDGAADMTVDFRSGWW